MDVARRDVDEAGDFGGLSGGGLGALCEGAEGEEKGRKQRELCAHGAPSAKLSTRPLTPLTSGKSP